MRLIFFVAIPVCNTVTARLKREQDEQIVRWTARKTVVVRVATLINQPDYLSTKETWSHWLVRVFCIMILVLPNEAAEITTPFIFRLSNLLLSAYHSFQRIAFEGIVCTLFRIEELKREPYASVSL